MTSKEAIETINIAMAEVEWDYPMDYTVAFEMAIDALERQMQNCEDCRHADYVQNNQMIYCKEIDKGDARIKAKIRDVDSWPNEELWEAQKWKKLDICTRCFDKMCIYIKTRSDKNEES